MSAYPTIQSRPIAPQIQQSCPQCNTQIEFSLPTTPPPPPQTVLNIQCYNCKSLFNHTTSVGYNSADRAPPSVPKRTGRKIGTQERPLETGYYDILEIKIDATTDEVKKAYSAHTVRVALWSFPMLIIFEHQDGWHCSTTQISTQTTRTPKNGYAHASRQLSIAITRLHLQFKNIAIAYQVLSDPERRKKYNGKWHSSLPHDSR